MAESPRALDVHSPENVIKEYHAGGDDVVAMIIRDAQVEALARRLDDGGGAP